MMHHDKVFESSDSAHDGFARFLRKVSFADGMLVAWANIRHVVSTARNSERSEYVRAVVSTTPCFIDSSTGSREIGS
jgi:alpha-beta hydrolase superfamily lysophospholipase